MMQELRTATKRTVLPRWGIDTSRLLIKKILCEGRKVRVVIDIAGAMSAISPRLVKELRLQIEKRTYPTSILAIYGQTIPTPGSVTTILQSSHKLTEVKGLSTARAVVSLAGPPDEILTENQANNSSWREEGTVLGQPTALDRLAT